MDGQSRKYRLQLSCLFVTVTFMMSLCLNGGGGFSGRGGRMGIKKKKRVGSAESERRHTGTNWLDIFIDVYRRLVTTSPVAHVSHLASRHATQPVSQSVSRPINSSDAAENFDQFGAPGEGFTAQSCDGMRPRGPTAVDPRWLLIPESSETRLSADRQIRDGCFNAASRSRKTCCFFLLFARCEAERTRRLPSWQWAPFYGFRRANPVSFN